MYTPNLVPTTADAIPGYLPGEFRAIANAFTSQQPFANLQTLHVAPPKPREGMIVKADGTDWNPGSGAGFYGYVGGAWVLFSGAGGITFKEVDGTPSGVATTLVLPNGTLSIVGSVATYTPTGTGSNDPYAASRVLLLHYVGYETQTSTLIDSSPFARTVSTGGVIDTFTYRFGGGSWFNSTNSALYTQIGSGALTGMNPSTGDFAIETQFLYDDAASFPVIFHATGSHTGRFYFAIYPGGKRLYVQFNGADWMFSPINQLKLNTWQHIMWSRIGGVSYMFINGFLVAFQGDTNDYQIGTSGVAIGIGFGSGANFRMQETSMIMGAGPSASFPNPGAMYT